MLKPRQLRVAHLISHPIQYFAPLYRELAKRSDVALTVFFYAGSTLHEHFDEGFQRRINWDVELVGGYDYYLSSAAKKRTPLRTFDWRLDLSIFRKLKAGKFDVIWIHGYTSINAWVAIFFGFLTRTAVFLRDDANLLTPRSRVRNASKQIILPLLFRPVVGLYVGAFNREFFKHYGVRRAYPVSYAVDNNVWRSRQQAVIGNRQVIRLQLGIEGEAPVILFCGKLTASKAPLLLLKAFAEVRKTTRCNLLLVGEGELREALLNKIEMDSIPDVHLSGFLNQTELPAAYISADVLVLPSAYDETWGLVVNEAMNFDLPVIVSSRVGCANEIVFDDINGYVFEAGNVDHLTTCLTRLVQSEELRKKFGRNSRDIVSKYGIEQSAQQLCDAFRSEMVKP